MEKCKIIAFNKIKSLLNIKGNLWPTGSRLSLLLILYSKFVPVVEEGKALTESLLVSKR